ncbi:hypothetical protein LOD99_1236 [Oopsacas minuta]|uniref:Uncharacterized protein n=1 Tax=Oopsacas minuta TaxID=111878 RepID=A0AAV7K6Y7_9METZ|nr:hypothetical protein LOD99_1236 [Oopsacas minuta]
MKKSLRKKQTSDRNADLFHIQKPKINNIKDELPNTRIAFQKDLNLIMNEIHCMNMKSLLGQKRRDYIKERVRGLGGKEPKRKYINYKDYMVQQKVKREEETKRKEEDRILGAQIFKKKNVIKGRGRWIDGKVKFGPNVGRLKRGVLEVSQKDIHVVIKNKT